MQFCAKVRTLTNKEISSDTIKNKAKRLLIPYSTYGVIFTIFYFFVTKRYCNEWYGLLYSRFCLFPLGEKANIFFLPSISTSPLWFLTALFMGFIIYYLMKRIKYRDRSYDWGKFLFCLSLTIVLYYSPILLPWSIDTAFLIAIFIAIGFKFKYYFLSFPRKKCFHLIGISSILAYFFFVLMNGGGNFSVREYGDHGIYSIVPFILIGLSYFIFIAYIFQVVPNFMAQIFATIGNLSLRLMCMHMPTFYILGKLIPIQFGVGFSIMIKIVAVIVIAWAFDKIVYQYKSKVCVLQYL